MLCGAKTRSGDHCQKYGMLNGRCRLHGGLSPKGMEHWNFQHGQCSKEARMKTAEGNAYVKLLKQVGIQFGLIG